MKTICDVVFDMHTTAGKENRFIINDFLFINIATLKSKTHNNLYTVLDWKLQDEQFSI